MSFASIALLLLSAAAPATGNSEEAAREALHEAAWTEVAPVPVPTTLPLIGPDGTDADGYPRRHVDSPALRALLLARRFAELTAAVESFQTSFERDPRHERWMLDSAVALGQPNSRERKLLDEWVDATPGSFAPYLARAYSWVSQGFVYRATKLARDTSSVEFAAMQEAFAAARRDAEAAIARRPGLVEARRVLMKTEVAGGSRERAQAAIDDALRICPTCYEIRVEWVGWALLPRWGGGYDEMVEFVVQRSDPASPMHRRLLGFVDFERSDEALGRDDDAAALAAIDRACALGDDWRFLRQRAAVKRGMNDHAGRLADLDRAEAVRPGIPWVLAARAWALADAGRWEEAGRDLLYVLRSEPASVVGNRIWSWVVQSLDATAWKQHEAGRAADATRLYDLAAALAPHHAGIAQRSALVRSARQTEQAAGPNPPTASYGLPVVTGEVVDEHGDAIAGARIFSKLALPPGVHQLPYLRETKVETDASGRFRLQLPAGRRALVATLPGEPLRASIATVEVMPTGAKLRIEVAGRGTISGATIDSQGRPVAGVVVTAIPKMEADPGQVRKLASATSGTDGRFTIQGVDGGDYEVWGNGDGRRGPYDHGGRGVPGRAGGEIVVRMDSPRILRGRVVVTAPDTAGGPTSIRVKSQAFGSHEISNADGSFSIPAANRWSRVDVAFAVPGLPTVLRTMDLGDGVIDAGTVVVGAGRRIRGHVVDPRGYDVSGADVLIGSQAQVEERIAVTRRDGTFEAVVAEGPARLRVRHERWLPAEREIDASLDDVEFALAEGAKIRFRVVDPDGVPLAKTPLALEELRTHSQQTCWSDATGRCEVAGLAPGDYVLRPRPPAAEPSRPVPPPLWLRLQHGDAVRGFDLVFPLEPSRVMVRVLDASGNPMDRAALAFPGAHSVGELFEGSVARLPYFQAARFDNLPPGRYTVVATGPWGPKDCGMSVIDVAPRSEQTLTVKLERDGCR